MPRPTRSPPSERAWSTRAGAPASWRSRAPTGCGRAAPASRRPTPAANPGSPGRRRCTPCRPCRSSGWTRRRRPPAGRSARRRARALGARRAAVLRRRGRAVHQRPDDRDRRLLRGGRRRDRRADPRRAARRRRLELRGRERVGALLVRHDDQRARRAARVRARDRGFRRGARGPPQRGGVPARARPVPPQEHGRGRRSGVSRLRVPLLLALRRAARARLLPPRGRGPGSPDGGGRRGRAVQAAARRPVAARPHPSGSRPLRPRGRRRSAQSVEHPPRAPGARLVGPNPPDSATTRLAVSERPGS